MFTEQELKIIMKLIDQGIRAEGLAAVEVLYPLAAKCSGLLRETEEKLKEISTNAVIP